MIRDLRKLDLAEVETLIGWAAAEGWNPGLDDAAAFYATDPDGFLGAFIGGEMAAGISAVAYDDLYGFIGLYICRPEWRGQGLGKTVWDAGIARLGGRAIGLDGVPEQQSSYRRMGFSPDYGTVRMSGVLEGLTPDGAVPISAALMNDVFALDRRCFPAARVNFLKTWLSPPRHALALVKDDRLVGYGVLRRCCSGHKIGPVFAQTPIAAADLLLALAAGMDGQVHIDVPNSQTEFLAMLTDLGFWPGFETARMYLGRTPTLDMPSVFATTSLELG